MDTDRVVAVALTTEELERAVMMGGGTSTNEGGDLFGFFDFVSPFMVS